jgi:hypothetical protein
MRFLTRQGTHHTEGSISNRYIIPHNLKSNVSFFQLCPTIFLSSFSFLKIALSTLLTLPSATYPATASLTPLAFDAPPYSGSQ